MMKDYIRLEKVESPLLELIPELNKTAGLHQMAYKLVCALLWVHGKINQNSKGRSSIAYDFRFPDFTNVRVGNVDTDCRKAEHL